MNLEAVRGQTQQAPQLRPMPPLQPPLVPLLQVSPPPLRPSPSSPSSSPPPSSSSSSSLVLVLVLSTGWAEGRLGKSTALGTLGQIARASALRAPTRRRTCS